MKTFRFLLPNLKLTITFISVISFIISPLDSDIFLNKSGRVSYLRPLSSVNQDKKIIETALAVMTPPSLPTLPPHLSGTLAKIAQEGSDIMVSVVMSDEKLVKALLATRTWDSEDDLRRTLRTITFGERPEDAAEAARHLAAVMRTGAADSTSPLVLAEVLVDRRMKHNMPGFMEIADSILRRENPDLAENLEALLAGDADVQMRAFHWLFDRMIEEAEKIKTDPQNAAPHILVAKIIIKQINRIISDTDNKKWFELRNHIIMRFAEELYAEATHERKPLMAAFMACYPAVSRDFFLAIDTNFVLVAKNYETKLYEKFCEAAETLLSFACLAWSDYFFDYLRSRYAAATPFMKAHYLCAMKFGIYTKEESEKPQLVYDRVNFILSAAIELCADKDERVKKKCREVLCNLPESFIAYISEGERYQSLDIVRRRVLLEALLDIGIIGEIEDSRSKVLAFIMYEVAEEDNLNQQKEILRRDYFSNDFLGQLDAKQSGQLRALIISNYFELRKDDIISRNCRRITTAFGLPAIEEAYEFFAKRVNVDYEKAVAALSLAAEATSAYETKESEEIASIRDMIGKVTTIAQRAIQAKLEAIREYFKLQEEISNKRKELEGLKEQVERVTILVEAAEEEVAELRDRSDELEASQKYLNKEIATLGEDLTGLNEAIDKYKAGIFETIADQLGRKWDKFKAWRKSRKTPEAEEGPDETGDEQEIRVTRDRKQVKQTLRTLRKEITKLEIERARLGGKLASVKNELAEIRESRAKLEEKQVSLAEEFVDVKNRLKELLGFVQYAEDKGRDQAMAKINEASRITLDISTILRQFLKGSFIEVETASSSYEKLKLQEEQVFITRLSIATNPRFANHFPASGVEAELAVFILLQSMHGIYKEGLLNELRYINELWQQGLLIPQSGSNLIFKVITDTVRKRLFEASQLSAIADLEGRLEAARGAKEFRCESLVAEVLQATGTTRNSLIKAMDAFLRLKFKPTGRTISNLMSGFISAVDHPQLGPQAAVSMLFFEISGESGKHFIEPEREKIITPKNMAQVIEKRYREYYKLAASLRKIVYESDKEIAKLMAGFGWDTEANGLAVAMLATLFNQEQTPSEVRASAEGSLMYIFLNWLDKWKADNEGNISGYDILSGMKSYLEKAPVINEQNRNEQDEFCNNRYVVLLCRAFAEKINEIPEKLIKNEVNQAFDILKKMENIISEDIVVRGITEDLHLITAIREAMDKLRRRMGREETTVSGQKVLEAPTDLRLPFERGRPKAPPGLPKEVRPLTTVFSDVAEEQRRLKSFSQAC